MEQLLDFITPHTLAELRRLTLRTRRRIDTDLVGQYRTAFRGSGLVFTDLRPYQPGDDIKHIHWKATARSTHVLVKSYEEDRALRMLVAVDCSSSTFVGGVRSKHRLALEFAALLGMLARESHDAIGIALFSDKIERFVVPRARPRQLEIILSTLSLHAGEVPRTDLAVTLRELAERQRRRATIFIVSDFYSPPFEQELTLLSHAHDVVCLLLHEETERDLPAVGLVTFEDHESGELITLDTSSKATRQELKRQRLEHQQRVKEICHRAGATVECVSDDPVTPLLRLMRGRRTRQR